MQHLQPPRKELRLQHGEQLLGRQEAAVFDALRLALVRHHPAENALEDAEILIRRIDLHLEHNAG
eukprot:scaffold7066_cov253-Pinguiococcus_pyrenoidosus.AAC.25